jgi:DNA repair exonuclease SbcCD nuclease subunit
VLHCGDVSEGNGKVYVGQQYELFVHGVDKQCSYIEEHYPYEEGVTTYMIAGNHDASFQKSAGHDLLQEITSHRDDLKYLGMFGAYFTIPGLDSTFYLHHPRGPIPYARSYRLQKTIEQMAPDQKPRVLLQGHLHISCHLPMYRNVEGFLVPCFQAQTPLLKAMGVYPTIGGLILELVVNESGLAAVKTEWWPFYVPHEDDY